MASALKIDTVKMISDLTTEVRATVSSLSNYGFLPTGYEIKWDIEMVKLSDASIYPPAGLATNSLTKSYGASKYGQYYKYIDGTSYPIYSGYLVNPVSYGDITNLTLYINSVDYFLQAPAYVNVALSPITDNFNDENYLKQYSLSGYWDSSSLYVELSYNVPKIGGEALMQNYYGVSSDFANATTSGIAMYSINYLDDYTWNNNTYIKSLTGDSIRINLLSPNYAYNISATPVDADYSTATYYIKPRSLSIIKNLSNTYLDYVTLNTKIINNTASLDHEFIGNIKWTLSEDTTAYFSYNQGSGIYIPAYTPYYNNIEVHWKQATFKFDLPSSRTVYISAQQFDFSDNSILSYTPATTEFSYEVETKDPGLSIQAISALDNNIWLKLNSVVYGTNTYNGTYQIPTIYPVKWDISPSTDTIMFSGLSGTNLIFPYNIISLSAMNYNVPYIGGHQGYTGVINSNPQRIGLDIIQLTYNPLSAITYSITASYALTPTVSTVYQFSPDMPTEAVIINPIYYDNQPFIKIYQLKANNDYFGQMADISKYDNIMWQVYANHNYITPSDSIWAKYTDGSSYTFGTIDNSINADTLNFYASTIKSQNFALSSFTVFVSAISGLGSKSPDAIETASYEFSAYEYPLDQYFDVQFKINNEDPRDVNNMMWRNTGTFNAVGTDLSNISGIQTGYSRIWDFGDGSIIPATIATQSHTYNSASTVLRTVNFTVSNANINKGVYSKECEDYMDLWQVKRFLSGDFIIYPTYVFPTSSADEMIDLNVNGYSYTQGVCAYGEGHVETFNISANESDVIDFDGTLYDTSYRVRYIGFNGASNIITSDTDQMTINIESESNVDYPSSGISVAMDVFNNIFPSTMVSAHTADNGNIEIHSNFGLYPNTYAYTSTNNSNLLFQNIRLVSYETPSCTLIPATSILIIPETSILDIDESFIFPNNSPVSVQSKIVTWTINTPGYNDTVITSKISPSTPAGLHYAVIKGNGIDDNTFAEGSTTIINISATGSITETIDQLDWAASPNTFTSNTISITAHTMPDTKIYSTKRYALTGEEIKFINASKQTPTGLISGFIWSCENGTVSSIQGFNDFSVVFNNIGTYSITVSAIAYNGYITTTTFNDIITIYQSYETYDPLISRTYGQLDYVLPYNSSNIGIPPNEWATENNINAALDRLNSNLNYIKSMSKIYMPPPVYYYGWYGSLDIVNQDTLRWHTDITSNYYLSGYKIADDALMNDINDICIKNGNMYIARKDRIEVRTNNYLASLLGSRTYKTIDDNFGNLVSIDVDSDGIIYVLDSLKNRVNVYTFDSNLSEPWELIYTWGGIGGTIAKNKYYNPTDLIVDNNHIWITDSNNKCIKKYSRSGGWIQTITSEYFTEDNKPISIALNESYIYALTNNNIIKLTTEGVYIETIKFDNLNTPKKIILSNDGSHLYICLVNGIIKITITGYPGGTFAFNDINYSSIYQDSDNNIYVSTSTTILKYYDILKTVNMLIDTNNILWDINDIYINKNEFIQDWVVNRGLVRMLDNINIIKRSLKGKLQIIKNTITDTYAINIIPFTIDEYNSILGTTNKNDMYVGVNELVTSDVLNRCFNQMLDTQNIILNAITDENSIIETTNFDIHGLPSID